MPQEPVGRPVRDPLSRRGLRRRHGRALSLFAVATLAVVGLVTPSAASAAGVTIDNCGVKVHVDRPLTRAVSLNQGATELMLTLGLQNRMIGTAYLDDQVLPSLKKAYDSVPVLAKEYPSAESFLSKRPDFAIASYASAFSDKEGVGTRQQLAKLGIQSYLMPAGCAGAKATDPATFDHLFAQIRQVAALFGVKAKGEQVIRQQRAALARARGANPPGTGKKIVWWDSDTKAPFVGACCGGPALIMRTVGATNVFAKPKGNWTTVDWESVAAANPDVIVLVDASWDTAKSKMAFLAKDPVMRNLDAVKNKRYVVIPFSDSTPGVRMVDGVERLAAGLRSLASNTQ